MTLLNRTPGLPSRPVSLVILLVLGGAIAGGCERKEPPNVSGENPAAPSKGHEGGDKVTPGLPAVPGTPAKPGEFTPAGKWETTEKLLLSAEDAKKLLPGSLRVSPDGKRVAYGVQEAEKKFAWVVDGTRYSYDRISPSNFVFSDDGKQFMHSGYTDHWTGRKTIGEQVYLNGKLLSSPLDDSNEWFERVNDLTFSRDGKHYLCTAAPFNSGGRTLIDGKFVNRPDPGVDVKYYRGHDRFPYTTTERHPLYAFKVEGKEIKAPGGMTELQFSTDYKTHVYITREGDWTEWVVVNGVPHKRMKGINSEKPNNVLLSDDGAHVLYAGQESGEGDTKHYVSYDNKWHEVDGKPSRPLTLSPDGTRWACRVGGSVWIDGKKGKEYVSVSGHSEPRPDQGGSTFAGPPTIVFSPDGKQVAHAAGGRVTDEKAKDRGRYFAFMVRDGGEGKQFAWVSHQPVFSTDGKFLAYFASDKLNGEGERFLTVDGEKVGKPYSGFHDKVPTAFSPDSKSVGFVAKKTGEFFAVLDGEEQKAYDVIGPEGTRAGFTPDGTYTFLGVRGGAYYWVEARRK